MVSILLGFQAFSPSPPFARNSAKIINLIFAPFPYIPIHLSFRYLNELFGKDCARLKLSKIMGVLVELRELCERSKEEELQRIKMKNVTE